MIVRPPRAFRKEQGQPLERLCRFLALRRALRAGQGGLEDLAEGIPRSRQLGRRAVSPGAYT